MLSQVYSLNPGYPAKSISFGLRSYAGSENVFRLGEPGAASGLLSLKLRPSLNLKPLGHVYLLGLLSFSKVRSEFEPMDSLLQATRE